MKKIFFILLIVSNSLIAHPVSYTINLEVTYNKENKEVKVVCTSNSKNKCGLYNFHLVDENENILVTKKFPFLKKNTKVKIEKKPYKMIFFLRKIPEHTYISIVK